MDRSGGWTRSFRLRLLVAVNAAIGAGLAFLLLVDYRQELKERESTLHVALEEEAKTLLPAIRRLSAEGEPAVRAHIDEVCGSMRESSSPGHHIAVETADRLLQARAHHRESPGIVAAMRRAARSPSRTAEFGDDAIIVGTATDDVRTVYVSEQASHAMRAVRRRALRRVGVFAFLGLVATVVLNLILLRLVIGPLGKLVATVRRIGAGELGAQAAGLRSRQLDYVASELNEMSTTLARADAERIAGMAKAKRIQAHLCQGARDAPGLRFAHYYRPAAEVAGDYYDVVRLSDGTSLICLADVTGHGVPAALGMATLKTLLVAASRSMVEPHRILAFANERFRDVTLAEDFASAVVVRWSPAAATIEYAGAGHEPGLLLQAPGEPQYRLVCNVISGSRPRKETGHGEGLLALACLDDHRPQLVPVGRVHEVEAREVDHRDRDVGLVEQEQVEMLRVPEVGRLLDIVLEPGNGAAYRDVEVRAPVAVLVDAEETDREVGHLLLHLVE